MNKTIEFTLNGIKYKKTVEMHWTLLRLLRDELQFTGTKEGCGDGECGACTVILNGMPVRSCLVLACEIDGVELQTIEDLAKHEKLDPIQQAFIDAGAVQCGFCTPGFIMATKALLNKNPKPDKEAIRKAFSGHLCRCTGYETIYKAIDLLCSK